MPSSTQRAARASIKKVQHMNRDTAWQIVTEFVADQGLRRHMLAVEAALRWYAPKFDADAEQWGITGLLHDFDWERHPNLEQHPKDGAPILRERGCDERIIQAILSHSSAVTGVERQDPIDFALLACDELTGLIVACALVRPSKDIREMKVKSIRKKWKDRAFAAGVDRDHSEAAIADFSQACFDGKLEQWEHIANVLEAMQGVAAELELDGRAAG
jgi:putative nucleotidyltransferase with HDIG domain